MSITSTTARNNYTGNGSTATYGYGFKIFNQGDITVTVRDPDTDAETTLTLTTDYTLTGVGDNAGGNVVLVDAGQDWIDGSSYLKSSWALTVRRIVDLTQNTDIRNQGNFYPEVHEDTFDYSRMIDLQQQDEIDRSAKMAETSTSSPPTLPTPVTNRGLYYNSDGNLVTTSYDMTEIPLPQSTTTTITNSMSATSITGYSFTPGSWVHIEYFVTRNSAAVLGSGYIDLHYDGSAWQIVEGPYNFKSGKALTHGLTFSMSTNQLQVADANASGSGSLVTRYFSM